MPTRFHGLTATLLWSIAVSLVGCGDDDTEEARSASSGSPEETASSCESAAECFEGLEVEGEALCLDRVRGGHCTHTCTTDQDCCAVEGECDTGLEQVCSPFESTGESMCFLSCEGEDVGASDYEDEAAYCQHLVGPDFICRSSGGGAANRKICVPGDCGLGASCAVDGDCSGELECVTELTDGYCGVRDCEGPDDCPGDAACVRQGGISFCAKPCASQSDCSFCRYGDEYACSDDVTFVGEGSGAHCLPD
jgi:hypothetical protein